jgi:hypothetical protein
MEWLDANRQLAGAVSRSGFVPGEGAAFCLLSNDNGLIRLGLQPLARVRSVAVGQEAKLIKTTDMCLGEGLTTCVRSAVGSLPPSSERINEIYCDINGERYRSEEWGFVCLRLPEFFDDATAYHSPANAGATWARLGAAVCGPGATFARGYSRGPRAMLWASSKAANGCRGVRRFERRPRKELTCLVPFIRHAGPQRQSHDRQGDDSEHLQDAGPPAPFVPLRCRTSRSRNSPKDYSTTVKIEGTRSRSEARPLRALAIWLAREQGGD